MDRLRAIKTVSSSDKYKVEIRKSTFSRRFNQDRYPGFRYCKTGKYSYHWESLVELEELSLIKKKVRRDRFLLKATPIEYLRGTSYRQDFFAVNGGPYRCRYCHKRLSREQVTVDHLVSVSSASKSVVARRVLSLMGAKSVNDVINLVPACGRCNGRKGSKGGLWFFRGYLRQYRVYRIFIVLLKLIALLMLSYAIYLVSECEQTAFLTETLMRREEF